MMRNSLRHLVVVAEPLPPAHDRPHFLLVHVLRRDPMQHRSTERLGGAGLVRFWHECLSNTKSLTNCPDQSSARVPTTEQSASVRPYGLELGNRPQRRSYPFADQLVDLLDFLVGKYH